MLSIESLVASGANVKLEISPSDLKMFAESIVEKTIEAQNISYYKSRHKRTITNFKRNETKYSVLALLQLSFLS